MVSVGWLIVLALPVYAAVQLALIVVLGRRFALREEDRSPRPSIWGEDDDPWSPGDASGSDSAVSCPACGAENEPGYVFCGHCVGRLSWG